jgi:Zn-dependent protease
VDQNENPHDEFRSVPPPITPMPQPPRKPGFEDKIKKALGPVGVAIVGLIVKFKFALLALAKFLPVLWGTGGTMIISIAIYAWFMGFWFAVGFVLLIFVHECGHLLAAKSFGLRVSAPMFIPFVGAVILLKEAPRNAWVESVVGIGGPVLGSLGALACEGFYLTTGNIIFRGLAYSGFYINLLNLAPVGFLDGGRVVTAISPYLWLVGFPILVYVLIAGGMFNVILLLILIMSLPRIYSLFRPKTDDERRYFEVTPAQRIIMSFSYFGLIAALVLGMRWTFLDPNLVRGHRNQVVIRAPDNLHAHELSRLGFSTHIDPAIDIRRVGLAACDPVTPAPAGGHRSVTGCGANQTVFPRTDLGRFQIARAGLALDQHHRFSADASGGDLPGDL